MDSPVLLVTVPSPDTGSFIQLPTHADLCPPDVADGLRAMELRVARSTKHARPGFYTPVSQVPSCSAGPGSYAGLSKVGCVLRGPLPRPWGGEMSDRKTGDLVSPHPSLTFQVAMVFPLVSGELSPTA